MVFRSTFTVLHCTATISGLRTIRNCLNLDVERKCNPRLLVSTVLLTVTGWPESNLPMPQLDRLILQSTQSTPVDSVAFEVSPFSTLAYYNYKCTVQVPVSHSFTLIDHTGGPRFGYATYTSCCKGVQLRIACRSICNRDQKLSLIGLIVPS